MARIVINPTTFKNRKDALCVAFDEGFRIIMEQTAFSPVSEPTREQREFFSDTEYADDELQLRRTIIARVCTLDTSVPRPTDSQIQESVEFLHSVLEIGACQNEWEQRCVQKLVDLVEAIPVRTGGAKKPKASAPNAAGGGGSAEDDSPQNVQQLATANAQATEEGASTENNAPTPAVVGNGDGAPTPVINAPDGSQIGVGPGGITGENAAAVSALMNAKVPTDYKDGNVWRDKDGQTIGNDEQYKQYQEAQKTLAGTGAYYDGGVFRTKTGAKIGGDLESVNQFARISKETAGTGAYYDAGTWRTKTGAKLDVSQWAPQKPSEPGKPVDATKPQTEQTVQGTQSQGNDRSGRIGTADIHKPLADVHKPLTVNGTSNMVMGGRKLSNAEAQFMIGRYKSGATMNAKQIAGVESFIKGNKLDITRGGKTGSVGKTISTPTASVSPVLKKAQKSSSKMADLS